MTHRFGRTAAALGGLAALLCLHVVPAVAGSPYPGWRGQPASSAPSGLGTSSRRPLDNSLRPVPPAAIWTGLYLGAHAGGAWGRGEPSGIAGLSGGVDTDGLIAGAHAGYNLQFDRLLLGLELDGDWADADGRRSYPGGVAATASLDWLSSLRLRMGMTFDDVMVYATGGIAVAGVELKTSAPGGLVTSSETLAGYVVGAGVEWKFARNISTRLEVLHYGFGEERLSAVSGPVDFDSDVTTVRAGLTLHLN